MFSAHASGQSFTPSAKNGKKIKKYCVKGRIDKLEKLKSQGYLPKIHSFGNKRLQGVDEITEWQDYATGAIMRAFYENFGAYNFNNLKKCYKWMQENEGVLSVNYKYERISNVAYFFNVGIIFNTISTSLIDLPVQNRITNWAVFFANELGYETDNLFDDDMGGRANCDLSIAVGASYTLENIKKLVNAGYDKNHECVQTAIRAADHRNYTQISNYLRSI